MVNLFKMMYGKQLDEYALLLGISKSDQIKADKEIDDILSAKIKLTSFSIILFGIWILLGLSATILTLIYINTYSALIVFICCSILIKFSLNEFKW